MSCRASPSVYSIHGDGSPAHSLSYFVAKNLNRAIHDTRFEITIPSLDNFVDGD